MHPQAFAYVARTLIGVPLDGARVLEIGSYDVNSSEQGLDVRALCHAAAHYYGIDARKGPGVDERVAAADFDGKAAYDLVLSTETAEHMPEPAELIACAWRALKPGGRLIVTAASPGRAPHSMDGNPLDDEPYQNITKANLKAWLKEWSRVQIEENHQVHDIYATAIKPQAVERKAVERKAQSDRAQSVGEVTDEETDASG